MTEPITSSTGLALITKVWGTLISALILGGFGWCMKMDKKVNEHSMLLQQNSEDHGEIREALKELSGSSIDTRIDVAAMRELLERKLDS
jgi:hypothetical protein